ncbi:DUF6484 domain-containing protein [uncultured Thiocystis sp.]|jgi:hypothetical protein|uniref:DUF6484 domain-containing protein n=1 Tax=uncultured Thiocystis sp. TaxID=1202134 RepID=UPI0025F984D4|nr:DUF6484 domain-containing protein [uncultured Thiocystis sp.]
MSRGLVAEHCIESSVEDVSGVDLLRPLIEAASTKSDHVPTVPGVVVGEIVAMTNEGRTPLVLYPGQPGTAALPARTVVDLHGAHIGHNVALMFEEGNPGKPIVMGMLREHAGWPLPERPGQVEVDADGERLLITAQEQLVLRCGKASITLTKAGKVLIQGDYVLSRSAGVNRVKGGSVQLN